MKIALIGYGKMGREIEAAAKGSGDTIAEIFEIDRKVEGAALAGVDVCIEFTTPQTALENIRIAIEAKTDIVVGTTGWYDRLPEIRPLVRDSAVLYSPNYSLGVNILFRLARRAAELIQNAPDYDAYVHELHHKHKADSPSGTALRLGGILLENIDRKKRILSDRSAGPIRSEDLHVSSTRVGTFAGTHVVGFDSEADTIELTHVAKNRRGFALGALKAARWVHGRKGVFTMDDVEL